MERIVQIQNANAIQRPGNRLSGVQSRQLTLFLCERELSGFRAFRNTLAGFSRSSASLPGAARKRSGSGGDMGAVRERKGTALAFATLVVASALGQREEPRPVPEGLEGVVDIHWVECIGIGWLVIYVLVFLAGRSRNRAIANSWGHNAITLLQKNFLLVGEPAIDRTVSNSRGEQMSTSVRAEIQVEVGKNLFTKDSQNIYKVYATGRRFCRGLWAVLELKPRHDLLSMIIGWCSSPWEDYLSVDVPMKEDAMDPFVFSILKKSKQHHLMREMSDLATYPRTFPLEFLPKSLCCLTDCDELVLKFFPDTVLALLSEHESLIEMIHLSDSNTLSSFSRATVPRKALRFRFRMPTNHSQIEPLLEIVMRYVDLVGKTNISDASKLVTTGIRLWQKESELIDRTGGSPKSQRRKRRNPREGRFTPSPLPSPTRARPLSSSRSRSPSPMPFPHRIELPHRENRARKHM